MNKRWTALIAAVGALVLLYLRRGMTLTQPQVWAEDGLYVVPQFLQDGWWSLFYPLHGYLILVSRLVSGLALTIAPQNYPLSSTVIAWTFTAVIAAYIAITPTLLRGRLWIALACFLIPADPEVLGTPLYTFWWSGLVLMVLVLWERELTNFGLRLASVIICGLSSPIIVLTLPLMAARAVLLRTRMEITLFAAAALCAEIQMFLILRGEYREAVPTLTWKTVSISIGQFFGKFALEKQGADDYLLLTGIGVMAATALALWVIRDRWVAFALLYLLAGSIALSVTRVDIRLIDPVLTAPRYFFYPFIVLAWILIEGLCNSRAPVLGRAAFGLVLIGALGNAAASGWSRGHDNIQWGLHVASCIHFDTYSMPIQFTGDREVRWLREYSRTACRKLAGNDSNFDPSRLYPFTVRTNAGHPWDEMVRIGEARRTEATAEDRGVRVLEQDVHGSNFSRSGPEGVKVFGSYVNSDADTGTITVAMQRGSSILFTSGPGGQEQTYMVKGNGKKFTGRLPTCIGAPQQPAVRNSWGEWCALEFSSDLLPEHFIVAFSDEGGSSGEWFAVGIFQ